MVSAAHSVAPADGSPQDPLPALITHERPSTVALATALALSACADHRLLVNRYEVPVFAAAVGVTGDRKHGLLEGVCSAASPDGSAPTCGKGRDEWINNQAVADLIIKVS